MDKRDRNGRFLPGKRIVGRQKGTGNKISNEIREKFQQLVDSYSLEQMKADLMKLDAGERLRIMTGLLDFFMPKLNRTDHSMTMGDETIIVLPRFPIVTTEGENRIQVKDESSYAISSVEATEIKKVSEDSHFTKVTEGNG
jgi:hypothetical protein